MEVEVREARAKLAKDLTVLRSPQTYRDFRSGLRSEAQSVLQRITEDLRTRAAANPSAALAIGAGIAWRLLKHPPVATALIGAGVLSLWRTTPVRVDEDDYLRTAQQRFGEQVSEAVATTRERASAYAHSAGERVQELSGSAAEQAAETFERAREAAAQIPDRAVDAAQRATSQLGRAVSNGEVRDQLLLGVAGLAVAAALGISYQRRTSDHLRAWD